MMKALVFILAISFIGTAQADWLRSDPSLKDFLSDIEGKTPKSMQKSLGTISIQFSLQTSFDSLDPAVRTFSKLGQRDVFLFRNRLLISSRLKEAAVNGPTHVHYNLAVKTVLFWLSRMYDDSSSHWTNTEDKKEVARCRRNFPKEKGRYTTPLTPVCRYYLETKHKVSDSLNYRSLSDYKGMRPTSKNELWFRVGSTEELNSVQDHFAWNLSQYLMDETYTCRRPAFAQFFSELLGQPERTSSCQGQRFVFTTAGGWKFDLNPSHIYQIHYLFASKGEELMSRWGHAMIRFVICSPEREEAGPACMEDEAYHLVLSYRANIDDVIINYWDGLTGAYPSQLMLFPMSEIVDEYTRGQWRDLISLPLNLTEKQKTLMISSTLEHYWSYSGDYKFITNNCATEADQLIRAVLPKNHPYQSSFAATPLGMYENLQTFKVIDASKVLDREQARSRGLLYPSNKESLEKAYDFLRGQFPDYRGLEDWASWSYPNERREVYEQLQDYQAIGAAYLLEKYVLLVRQRQVQGTVSKQLQMIQSPELSDIVEKLIAASKERLPWQFATDSYGIPLAEELISDEEVANRYRESAKWSLQYREALQQSLADVTEELDEIRDNMQFLVNRRRFQ